MVNTPFIKYFNKSLSELFNLIEPEKKRMRKRKLNPNPNQMMHKCNLCQKVYYSHPALYTHKRNKHNVIPMRPATNDIKPFLASTDTTRFHKYSDFESFENFHESVRIILDNFKNMMTALYGNETCLLYQKDFKPEEHNLYITLRNLTKERIKEIMTLTRTSQPRIDEVIVTYIMTFNNVTNDTALISYVIKFFILLREYLNNLGWDYKQMFYENGIDIGHEVTGPYCVVNDCEYIPDLIHNFISVFVGLDPLFWIDEKFLITMCENFCNWLLVNELTNYKIESNEL